MSTLKIVGTETELRIDFGQEIPDPDYGEDGRRLHREVVNAAILERGVTAINRDNFYSLKRYMSESEAITSLLNTEISNSADLSVREHLAIPGNDSPKMGEYLKRYGSSGAYLFSGHRIYLDMTHPEVSTPECSSPLDLVKWEKAGMMLIEDGRQKAESKLGTDVILYKNISDYHGNSWGAHENYLVSNELFSQLVLDKSSYWLSDFAKSNICQKIWATFLVTRYIYCGNGKMGFERSRNDRGKNIFLLSQRSEFIDHLVSPHTTGDRAFINQRDISYTSDDYGRRLHVICGDANMCDMAIYLKTGMAMVVLMMLEDLDAIEHKLPLIASPTNINYFISQYQNLGNNVSVNIGNEIRLMSTADVQRIFLDTAIQWYENICQNEHPSNRHSWMPELFKNLDFILGALKDNDIRRLYGKVDWATKLSIILNRIDKLGCGLSNFNHANVVKISGSPMTLGEYVKSIDMAYHRLDDKGLFNRLVKKGKIDTMVSQENVLSAIESPPEDTRAYDRVWQMKESKEQIFAMNWNRIKSTDSLIELDNPWRESV